MLKTMLSAGVTTSSIVCAAADGEVAVCEGVWIALEVLVVRFKLGLLDKLELLDDEETYRKGEEALGLYEGLRGRGGEAILAGVDVRRVVGAASIVAILPSRSVESLCSCVAVEAQLNEGKSA